jgi:hypothetical protein
MRVATFIPKLPVEAKKIVLWIGFLNFVDGAYRANTMKLSKTDKKDMVRSRATKVAVCAGVSEAMSKTA